MWPSASLGPSPATPHLNDMTGDRLGDQRQSEDCPGSHESAGRWTRSTSNTSSRLTRADRALNTPSPACGRLHLAQPPHDCNKATAFDIWKWLLHAWQSTS